MKVGDFMNSKQIGYGDNRLLFEQVLERINISIMDRSREKKPFDAIECLREICEKTENNINFLTFVAAMCLYSRRTGKQALLDFFSDTFHDKEIDDFCNELFDCTEQFCRIVVRPMRTSIFHSSTPIIRDRLERIPEIFHKIYLLNESEFAVRNNIEITAYYMNWLFYTRGTKFRIVCNKGKEENERKSINEIVLSLIDRLSRCLIFPGRYYKKLLQNGDDPSFVHVSREENLEFVLPYTYEKTIEFGVFESVLSTLDDDRQKIKESEARAEQAIREKKQVISEFAHTYANMRTTTLHDIGTELLEVGDPVLHDWGRKIMVEFAIKQNLTKEVEMLRLQFEDNTSELISKIRDTVVSSDGLTVFSLVSDALQRCFMALLYGETRADKSRRKLFFGTDDFACLREELQDSFDEDVLINGNDMLSWLKQNGIFKVSAEASGAWEKLQFDNGGYAALLLTNWIAELLTNAMKYADKSKDIRLTFEQRDDMLYIGIGNEVDPATKNIHGGGHGISSIAASVTRLNQAVGLDSEAVIQLPSETDYQLKLCIASAVFTG